jgi:DNA-binding MarR family transcriptional regulator
MDHAGHPRHGLGVQALFPGIPRLARGHRLQHLTDRLKRLEESGIVARRPDPENARQVIYTLTEKGKDLIPALLELARWGAKHVARSVAPRNIARRIKDDRDGLIEELKASLK